MLQLMLFFPPLIDPYICKITNKNVTLTMYLELQGTFSIGKDSSIAILLARKKLFYRRNQCSCYPRNEKTHYSTPLHYTTLHYTTLHYTTLHYTTLHYTTLHYTTLHYTTLHYTTLHCTALHCTALHCTALHCTALHCTTLKLSLNLIPYSHQVIY